MGEELTTRILREDGQQTSQFIVYEEDVLCLRFSEGKIRVIDFKSKIYESV